MTNQPAVTFAYDALADADAARVRLATGRLRAAITSTARLVVRIGLQLAGVRRCLKPYRGAWDAYVRAGDLPWSRGQVYRLIRAAKAFRRAADVDRFQPTALYLLAWPDAPPAATRAALRLARDGHRIDAATARRLIAEHRPAPPGGTALPAAAEAPAVEIPPADGAALAELVDAAMARFTSLHVSRDPEGDGVTVVGYPEEEGAALVHKQRGTLALALAAALGRERAAKRCPTCAAERPLGRFCRNADEPDGLNRYCRDCAKGFREKQAAKKGPRAKRPRRRPVV